MKGIVFTEFLEMVEDQFSPQLADTILEKADMRQADGSFTRVGTYHHADLIALVLSLSEETGADVAALVRAFGRYLFGRFVEGYPNHFEGIDDATDFLKRIHKYVHVDVLKLYPDAELPAFDWTDDEAGFSLTYRSSRPFADLAHGLIEGCLAHYGDGRNLRRDDLAANGTEARFVLSG